MCENCKKLMFMSMLISSECEACGRNFVSPGAPPLRYCSECAERIGLCEFCGKSMYEQMTFFDD